MKNLKSLTKGGLIFLIFSSLFFISPKIFGADVLVINNASQYTKIPSVTLTIDATAIGFDAVDMRFSNDNSSWTNWESYATNYSWDITNILYGGDTGQGVKNVYVQFRNGIGDPSSVQSDNIIYDTTSPLGTIKIRNGSRHTRFSRVLLNLLATDNLSGVLYMRFSNGRNKWTGWRVYNTLYGWDLNDVSYGGVISQGRKRVYVQFKDRAENVSALTPDAIIHDKNSPKGNVIINRRAVSTKSARVILSIRARDNISGLRYMRFSNNSKRWTRWKRYKRRYRWLLTKRYGGTNTAGTKCVYIKFKDRAGNISGPIKDCIYLNGPGGTKRIEIDLSSQTLSLFRGSVRIARYLISSGRPGMETPRGRFRVLGREINHWSRKYSLYMPYSLRFYGDFFIHELPYWPGGYREGTWHLGIPVSHGCVRLGIGAARRVYRFAKIGTGVFIHR
ncbi:MAG: L,D-transpeptidase [Candidatus Pacebacteria bacterium]|nr:L,D-transpeptidase [Candidatus Paceibacterota bacterium]